MSNKSYHSLLCGVIGIFLFIVLWNINRESFWGDEAFSVYSIGRGENTKYSPAKLGFSIFLAYYFK